MRRRTLREIGPVYTALIVAAAIFGPRLWALAVG